MLRSFGRCLEAELLTVWRRVPGRRSDLNDPGGGSDSVNALQTKTREKTIVENVGSIINDIIWGAIQECSTRGGQFLPSQLFQHHQLYISNCNIDCLMHLLYSSTCFGHLI